MAKIARKNQKIFGSSAGLNQIGEFGSLAAGSVAYTTDVETIQTLSNYLTGWFGAVVGGNSPAIEDMNALCYMYAYQLAYLMQSGIAEWNSATTYYIGSFASDGAGNFYVSLTDTNLANALTDTTKWRLVSGGVNAVAINPATQSPYTMTTADWGKTFLVNTANGAMTFTLPTPTLNLTFTVKDKAGSCGTYNITFARHASEKIENLAASFIVSADYGSWTFISDGTDWFLV